MNNLVSHVTETIVSSNFTFEEEKFAFLLACSLRYDSGSVTEQLSSLKSVIKQEFSIADVSTLTEITSIYL